MKTQLRLFLDWGIRFGKAYELPEKAARPVSYANKKDLIQAITERHPQFPMRAPTSSKSGGGMWEQEPPTAEYESNRSSSHRGPYNLSKGYNPIYQIVGYILTEDPTYITNHKGARGLISHIEREELLKDMINMYLN